MQSSFHKAILGPDLKDLWNDYQAVTEHQGSGADLLGQACGMVAQVDMSATAASPLAWPYPELGFCIVRTQQKLPTHAHLQSLDRSSLSLLSRPAHECVEAFGRAPAEVFVGHLKNFSLALRDFKLQASHTLALINLLEKEEWCLLAKGCGALGADTVLVLFPIQDRDRVQTFARKQSLKVVATHADLSGGIGFSWSTP
ncbi:MAG: hypothetical protein HC902_11370 [Calothrix sp. SM1_5_4]|nr:hypothetical protein [Calothrix sp. SM1_5_4]